MRGNPFMPRGTYRKGMYNNGSRSASEVVGIGMKTLAPVAKVAGSLYGSPQVGNAVGEGMSGLGGVMQPKQEAAAMSLAQNEPSTAQNIGAGVQAVAPVANAFGPWGALVAKGVTELGDDIKHFDEDPTRHLRRIAAAGLLGAAKDFGPIKEMWA